MTLTGISRSDEKKTIKWQSLQFPRINLCNYQQIAIKTRTIKTNNKTQKKDLQKSEKKTNERLSLLSEKSQIRRALLTFQKCQKSIQLIKYGFHLKIRLKNDPAITFAYLIKKNINKSQRNTNEHSKLPHHNNQQTSKSD